MKRARNFPVRMGLFIMILFLGELLFYTWCRVQCVRVGYEIGEQAKANQRLVALQNNLKIELAHLKSPERMGRIARDRFGLAAPTSDQIIFLP